MDMSSGGPMNPASSQTDALALVREVTAAVASTHEVDEVLTLIARLTGQALEVTECDIYEYDPRARRLTATATWNTVSTPEIDEKWLGDTIDIDAALEYRYAIESRQPVEEHIDDLSVSRATHELMEQWGEKSWLVVPLIFGDLPIGVLLLVEHRSPRRFGDDEKELATSLAVPAAIAIHNARLHRQMAEQNRHLSSLVDSSRAINSTVDLDEVLMRVAREACEALDTSQSSIYIHDPEQEALIYQILYDRTPTRGDPDDPIGYVCPFSHFPGERAILFSDDIVIEHESDPTLPADRRRSLKKWGEKTVLSVPLIFHDQRLGILRLYEFDQEREFTPLELQLARGLGELAGAAINNAQGFRREQMRSVELETLLEASKAMASSMVLDEVLQQLSERAAVALRASQCLIYEYDAERDTSTLRASFAQLEVDVSEDAPCGTEFPLDDYPNDREIMARGVPVVDHIQDPDLAPDVRESMLDFGYGTCLTVPFIFRGEPLGTMELIVMGDDARRFSASEVELARGLAELAGAALHNARSFRREQTRSLELETLLEASKAMASSMELDEVLDELARRAAVALGTPQCLIYEHDSERDLVILRSTYSAAGIDTDDEDRVGTEYSLEDYPSDRELLEAGEIVEERLSDPDLGADVRASMELFGEKTCLTVPLHFRGRSLGMMELIEHGRERHFTEREVQLARALAEQAAIALNNARLYKRSKEYAERLESSYLETVTALAAAMEAKDHYTAEHADMLAMMAVSVGRKLGLNESELRDLQYASVLHDIGKIGIPGNILNKPDKLTDEEFAVMAEHTIIGERIISAIDYLAPIGRAIRAAHERWDGRGYPDGVAGEQIPRAARILFVCDAFHAMTSDRPYRKAMPAEEALEELRRNAGKQFDPEVVEAFLEVWPRFEESAVEPRTPNLN
jgi:HD-GYP domain-containing protein (c-di-GMP phosphodiesterase class II)